MITLQDLRWSNAFSYGPDNYISFVRNPLTQLVGKNGHGKSSIALILEEVLFNKNSKGIKKGDILNRYSDAKTYTIEVTLSIGTDVFSIKSTRGSTQTVKLVKNGEDISAHTATATYKMIEELLGMDHKTFSQIVYQSSAASLEFLTTTDSNRKKFLIELLSLDKYTRAAEVFKSLASLCNKDVTSVQSKVDTINSWLAKYANTDLSRKPLIEVPVLDEALQTNVAALQAQIQTIDKENAKIAQNNTYKAEQQKLNVLPAPRLPQQPTEHITASIAVNKKAAEDAKTFIKKMSGLSSECPTCLQKVNTDTVKRLVLAQEVILDEANKLVAELEVELSEVRTHNSAYTEALKSQQAWEKYHAIIDVTLPSDMFTKEELATKVQDLRSKISSAKQVMSECEYKNSQAEAHNAKVSTISEQLAEFKSDLLVAVNNLDELNKKLSVLNVLNKAFSTTGLIAYKIECLVKDLELLANEYLVELSDGRFQISFQVSTSDKLNVVITDNGKDIDILALSGGERARVNVSALLAIRKLMQSLSSSRINLLILDETVEALDVEGKERLIEVLLKEDSLNTFLISHGFQHPLLEKVNVIKTSNISRIEV